MNICYRLRILLEPALSSCTPLSAPLSHPVADRRNGPHTLMIFSPTSDLLVDELESLCQEEGADALFEHTLATAMQVLEVDTVTRLSSWSHCCLLAMPVLAADGEYGRSTLGVQMQYIRSTSFTCTQLVLGRTPPQTMSVL